MSEHITSIPAMLNQHKHNISQVAKLLGVDRKTVSIFRDDKDCNRHIVVRGRLMTETRRLQDGEVILAKDPNYYDSGGSDGSNLSPN